VAGEPLMTLFELAQPITCSTSTPGGSLERDGTRPVGRVGALGHGSGRDRSTTTMAARCRGLSTDRRFGDRAATLPCGRRDPIPFQTTRWRAARFATPD
jgi:hypothetical protein